MAHCVEHSFAAFAVVYGQLAITDEVVVRPDVVLLVHVRELLVELLAWQLGWGYRVERVVAGIVIRQQVVEFFAI